MSSVTTQISNLFFPPEIPENREITFDAAIDALDTRRLARITKAALFALSSIVGTVMLILTETAVLTWPIAIPLVAVTLVAGLIFYRLNSLDSRYVEFLTDKTKEKLVQHELNRILLSPSTFTTEEVTKSLNCINRLLDMEAFDAVDRGHILNMHAESLLATSSQSIAEFAYELGKPIKIDSKADWFDQGRFGLPSFARKVEVVWSGIPNDNIHIIYTSIEKNKDGSDVKKKEADVEAEAKIINPVPINLETA